MKHIDILGKEIKVGDYVLYSAVDGRSGVLRIGQVLALGERKPQYDQDQTQTIRVKAASIGGFSGKIQAHTKPSTLSFLRRVAVIEKEKIPQEWLTEIEKVKGK